MANQVVNHNALPQRSQSGKDPGKQIGNEETKSSGSGSGSGKHSRGKAAGERRLGEAKRGSSKRSREVRQRGGHRRLLGPLVSGGSVPVDVIRAAVLLPPIAVNVLGRLGPASRAGVVL